MKRWFTLKWLHDARLGMALAAIRDAGYELKVSAEQLHQAAEALKEAGKPSAARRAHVAALRADEHAKALQMR